MILPEAPSSPDQDRITHHVLKGIKSFVRCVVLKDTHVRATGDRYQYFQTIQEPVDVVLRSTKSGREFDQVECRVGKDSDGG